MYGKLWEASGIVFRKHSPLVTTRHAGPVPQLCLCCPLLAVDAASDRLFLVPFKVSFCLLLQALLTIIFTASGRPSMRCSRWEWRWWNLEKPRVAYGRRKELLLTGPLACCCRGAIRSLSPRVWWGCWATLPLRRRSLRHWRRFVQDKRKYSLFKIKWALRSKNLYSNNKVSPLYIRCKNVNFRVGESENPVRTARNCTYFALFSHFSSGDELW